MGEHNRGREHRSVFERSAYGIPLDANWDVSRGAAVGVSSIMERLSPGLRAEDERESDPARAEFWVWPGAGHRLLMEMAAAHVGIGLLGAAASALVEYLTPPPSATPMLAAIPAAMVALAGTVAFALARVRGPRAALAARALLPAVDIASAGVLLWLLGDSALTVLVFVVPAIVASLLLSWRSGALCAAAGVVCFAGMNALWPGVPLQQWAGETLALAGVVVAIVLGVGMYASALGGVRVAMRAETVLLRGQSKTQAAEQLRLLETLNLLEDAQARLERERVQVNLQIAEAASAAHRLADGDFGAVRSLQPGMFGPLEAVRGALGRLSLRLGMSTGSQTVTPEQLRALEAVVAANREQAQLLAAMDTALRALGVSANELVAEVQLVERGSGELPGLDRHRLFQVMRGMEQRALAQASNTAILGARLAQLRTRQSEMAADLRQLNRLNQLPGGQLEWERSGPHRGPVGAPPEEGEAHYESRGDSWR